MALDQGLLLERSVANSNDTDDDDDGYGARDARSEHTIEGGGGGSASPVPSADSAGGPDMQPTLFTLLHPLEELRPVNMLCHP